MTGGGGSGEEDEAEAVVEAIDGEIAAVDGEDFAEALALGEAEEGGVGEGNPLLRFGFVRCGTRGERSPEGLA
jgi:hypothetical protein